MLCERLGVREIPFEPCNAGFEGVHQLLVLYRCRLLPQLVQGSNMLFDILDMFAFVFRAQIRKNLCFVQPYLSICSLALS